MVDVAPHRLVEPVGGPSDQAARFAPHRPQPRQQVLPQLPTATEDRDYSSTSAHLLLTTSSDHIFLPNSWVYGAFCFLQWLAFTLDANSSSRRREVLENDGWASDNSRVEHSLSLWTC